MKRKSLSAFVLCVLFCISAQAESNDTSTRVVGPSFDTANLASDTLNGSTTPAPNPAQTGAGNALEALGSDAGHTAGQADSTISLTGHVTVPADSPAGTNGFSGQFNNSILAADGEHADDQVQHVLDADQSGIYSNRVIAAKLPVARSQRLDLTDPDVYALMAIALVAIIVVCLRFRRRSKPVRLGG